ncbi:MULTISPECIES: acyltransferase [unclassified Pseudomonas]|uniref:acyltransferase family protein n=1 Tax=unclassified Pseudomonas TaxID=196821 RepID=UPI001F581BD3
MYKLSSLQAARGLAALFVVAFHSLFINAKYVQGESLLPELFVFGQTGVDLFFVISGFVMVLAFRNKFGLKGQVADFLKGRFLRIYPTYWVYFLALFFVAQIKPELVGGSKNGDVDMTSSFFLLPDSALPLLMVAWSLIHEVWFYLVFALILILPAKWMTHAFAFWLITIIGVSIFTPTSDNPYLRVMFHEFSIEFIFGALAGIAYLRLSLLTSQPLFSILLMVLAGLTGLVYALASDVVGDADVIQSITLERAFAIGGGYTLLLLAFALLEAKGKWMASGLLRSVGDMSYSLYLSHVLTLSVCGRLWVMTGLNGNSVWHALLFWAVSYTAVLVVAYFSYQLIERKLLNLSQHFRLPVRA